MVHSPARMVPTGIVSPTGIPGTRNLAKTDPNPKVPLGGRVRGSHQVTTRTLTSKSPSGAPYTGHIRLQLDPFLRIFLETKSPSGARYAGHIRLQHEHLNRFQTESPATTLNIVFITTPNNTMDHLSGPRLGHKPALSWLHRARAKSDSQASAAREKRTESEGDVGRTAVFTGMLL